MATSAANHPDAKNPVINLTCCVCGTRFLGRQFKNQDTGWGLGDCCVEFMRPREPEMDATYGIDGVHFGLSALVSC